MKLELETKVWRDPATRGEEKTRKRIESERDKAERANARRLGRQLLEERENSHLASLKYDVARLEQKASTLDAKSGFIEEAIQFTIRGAADDLRDLRILSTQDQLLQFETHLVLPRDSHRLSSRAREQLELQIGTQLKELEKAMARGAVALGANGIIEYTVEGPTLVKEGPLIGKYRLFASGYPVLLDTSTSDALPQHASPLRTRSPPINRYQPFQPVQPQKSTGTLRSSTRDTSSPHRYTQRLGDPWTKGNERGEPLVRGANALITPELDESTAHQHRSPPIPSTTFDERPELCPPPELARLPFGPQAYARYARALEEREGVTADILEREQPLDVPQKNLTPHIPVVSLHTTSPNRSFSPTVHFARRPEPPQLAPQHDEVLEPIARDSTRISLPHLPLADRDTQLEGRKGGTEARKTKDGISRTGSTPWSPGGMPW